MALQWGHAVTQVIGSLLWEVHAAQQGLKARFRS